MQIEEKIIEEAEVKFRLKTVFEVDENGKRIIFGEAKERIVEFAEELQPTQLDRIEEQLAARNDALRQEGADALTLELLERGIL